MKNTTQHVLSIVAMALCTLIPGRALAEWKEYVFHDLGIAIQFPAEPARENSEYRTVVIGYDPAQAVNFSADVGEARFKLTVVDLRAPELSSMGANIMGECYFDIEREGKPIANIAHRVQDGTAYGVHGRIVTVDIDEEGRKELGCFFAAGRLYRSETIIPISADAAETQVVARFVRSMRFDIGEE